jgi:polygalacturonase
MMKWFLQIVLHSLFLQIVVSQQKLYSITEFGAISDGHTVCTVAIQSAIDKAGASGEGVVIIPNGTYITGTLYLKTGVNLHLEPGAFLLGSTSRLDYGENIAEAMICAKYQKNISITGQGTINGQGAEVVKDLYKLLHARRLHDEKWRVKRPNEKSRPELVAFSGCSNVNVSGVTLKNSASWVLTFRNSSQIKVDSLSIESTAYWNNDGIDVVNCKDVHVSNCKVDCADDAICLKSEGETPGICENVTVENCILRSSASAFKIGTGSYGGFKNIIVRNLTVYDTYRSAIAIECVDGGALENVDIRNVNARNTGNAFFIRLGHRNKTGKAGSLKNVTISNVYAEISEGKPDIGYPIEGPLQKYPHNVFPASITGIPGSRVSNVIIENIEITSLAKADTKKSYFSVEKMASVPEKIDAYPEFSMFGELPAWGLYVRHTDSIQFKNIRFIQKGSDYRPCILFDDVNNLLVNGLYIQSAIEPPHIILNKVSKHSLENVSLPVENEKGILVKNN